MRNNLPITNKEYVLNEHETIVSKTDIHGNITYVNDDFVKISGFTREELIGAPQNIVRHPDMPSVAFEDFWATVKAGKAWTGLVKNRCKNGDHYWVEATAAPIVQNRQIIGFTSVRVKPTREQVKAAEDAYRAIRNGDTSIIIKEGRARPFSRFYKYNFFSKLSISAKLKIYIASMIAAFGIQLMLDYLNLPEAIHLLVTSVGMFISAFLGYNLYIGIVPPLRDLKKNIDDMSSGDLTVEIHAHGRSEVTDIQHGLRVLNTNIKLLIGQIKQSVEHVSRASSEIADGNSDLSARTESQASSLEETASSMEEITSTVEHNAANSREGSVMFKATSQVAEKGGEVVSEVVKTMHAIRTSSSKISDIISVIDSIAFQTNLLALNASVEAARAGEQGRGFAVVASEVRGLAGRCANAAKEIKDLINESVRSVELGSNLVDKAGESMTEIVQSVKRAETLINDICEASQEQSSGIQQINQAVMQMDTMTQQNAALVEQAAASAESLRQQSFELSKLMNSFTLTRAAGYTTPSATRVTSSTREFEVDNKSQSHTKRLTGS